MDSASAARTRTTGRQASGARRQRRRSACETDGWVGSGTAGLPVAVWPCAQRTSQWQRKGRYTPESNEHPAKMLPEIARRVIEFYSQPGDVVLDPMCGVATTLIEALHQGRVAIGLELEQRWATLAASNIEHARTQGAAGQARVLSADARNLGNGLLDEHAGKVSLILTSPPYGDATLGDPRGGKGMAVARRREGRALTANDQTYAASRQKSCKYGSSKPCLARLPYGNLPQLLAGEAEGESYLSAMAGIYEACARMLAPGGYLVLVTKNLRSGGILRNLAADTALLCQHAGLDYHQHVIALLAGIKDDRLIPRPSFWQLLHARKALAAGERTQLVIHEDVQVFRKPHASQTSTTDGR
jgi:DNA methylase